MVKRNNKGQFIDGHEGYKPWLGKKRGVTPKDVREKISKSLVGKKKTKSHRNSISMAQKGKNNSMYRNGKHKDSHGYWLVLMPEHSRANLNGYVFEHRLVMENYLGRFLEKTEIVHHIDFNPENNNINNLALVTVKEHMKLHSRWNELVKKMLDKKLVYFDDKEKRYKCTI